MKTHGSSKAQLASAPLTKVRQYLDDRIYQPPARGVAVRHIQEDLNTIFGAVLSLDGIYGPNTTKAVRRLQDQAGITVDGAVGPETKRVLKDRYVEARIEEEGTTLVPRPVAPSSNPSGEGDEAGEGDDGSSKQTGDEETSATTPLLALAVSGGVGYGAYTLWNQLN